MVRTLGVGGGHDVFDLAGGIGGVPGAHEHFGGGRWASLQDAPAALLELLSTVTGAGLVGRGLHCNVI